MKRFLNVAYTLLALVALLATVGCNGSTTHPSTAPMISMLQVQGAQRVSGSAGLLSFSIDYVDPEADIDRFAINVGGGGLTTNPLAGAGATAGRVAVLQTVDLPAPGTSVSFSIFVVDRRQNRSNTLNGTFVAP